MQKKVGMFVVIATVSAIFGQILSANAATTKSDRPQLLMIDPIRLGPTLSIGAAVNDKSGSSVTLFKGRTAVLGPLTYRRSFDPSLPETFQKSAAKDDAKYGYKSFVSWKPPSGDYVGAANGKYDTAIIRWAKSVPNTGVYATAFHEPENDMTAAQFVALQQHLYTVVKTANPTIQWGPVYMAYWWAKGTSHYIGDPNAWWPGDNYADFSAIDNYNQNEPTPLSQDKEFMSWYSFMKAKPVPLVIAEYGQYVVKGAENATFEAERAKVIAEDAQWIKAQGRFSLWMYWDALGPEGDWRLNDKASQNAWKSVASANR